MSEGSPDARGPARRPYRRIAALVVLVGGVAAIAATVSSAKKEPAIVWVGLPAGIQGLRMDVHREGTPEQQLVEHLEWSYLQATPASQVADLDLAPGKYLVTLHPLGPSGRDPGPLDLEVRKGEPARLDVDLKAQ